MVKVVKAPPECKDFGLGSGRWEVDKNGIVRDLSPDDLQFPELRRLFNLEIVDMPDAEKAEAVKPQEEKEKS